MKKICLFVVFLITVLLLTGCQENYELEWMIDKDYTQIVERYGEFDGAISGKDFRNDSYYYKDLLTTCKNKQFVDSTGYYIIEPSRRRPLGDLGPETRLEVRFDSNGKVIRCLVEQWYPA